VEHSPFLFPQKLKQKHVPLVVRLNLNDVRDLFVPTKLDPFHPNYHHLSGMEQIRLALKNGPRHHPPLAAIVRLPASAANQSNLQAETEAAIGRYCAVRIAALHDEAQSRKKATLANLRIGIIILGLSLGLAAAVSNVDLLASWLRTLLSNSIGILGTVALWSPADAFLFGLRPLYGDLKLYKTIKQMTVTLEFDVSQNRPSE
jgi:hypothetical protein